MKANINELEKICVTKLLDVGFSEEDAEIIFSHLLDEELLEKHSHGFIRMMPILNTAKGFSGKASIETEEVSNNAMRLSVENTVGIVAAQKATKLAIQGAAKNGIYIVAGTGYKGTTGALGYYGRMIAAHGLIGIVSCSSEYAVAPWGSKDAILGTNPIAIAIPFGEFSIVSDFATSAMTYGELMLDAKEGREVPYGIVLNAEGKPSHDPEDANNGCQLPMAGHKGYALGLAVEIMAGLFIGAKAGKDAVPGSDGIIIQVLKPDLFVSKQQFLSNLRALADEILQSAPAYGSSGIRLPGESSVEKIREARKSNVCTIPDAVYQELINL